MSTIREEMDKAWGHYLAHKSDVLGDEYWKSHMRYLMLKNLWENGKRWAARQRYNRT